MPRIFNRAKGYLQDSKFEVEMTNTVLDGLKYHPMTLKWISPAETHKYTPDWVLFKDNKHIYIEGKGFLKTEEKKKYVFIKDGLSEHEELVFLFQYPKKPIQGATKRKDGTKMSHAEWAEKNNFRWFSKDTVKDLLQ